MSARNRGIFGMERVANEARRLGRGCVSHSGVQTHSYSSHGAGTVASEGKRVMSTGGHIRGSCNILLRVLILVTCRITYLP